MDFKTESWIRPIYSNDLIGISKRNQTIVSCSLHYSKRLSHFENWRILISCFVLVGMKLPWCGRYSQWRYHIVFLKRDHLCPDGTHSENMVIITFPFDSHHQKIIIICLQGTDWNFPEKWSAVIFYIAHPYNLSHSQWLKKNSVVKNKSVPWEIAYKMLASCFLSH